MTSCIKNMLSIPGRWFLLVLVIPTLLASCAGSRQIPTPSPTLTPPQLRIKNSGSVAIEHLVMLFPGSTSQSPATRITIGTIPAGSVSTYLSVPRGVYRYAAYEYQVAGQVATQAVTDWMGERPMPGQQFTYDLRLDPTKPIGGQIELVHVTTDVP